MSFIEDKIAQEGITFDDVLLVPAFSEVTPDKVKLHTRFSRHITLNIPVVSAAMDTVTEAPLAIAIAREGGIGVIHKNMSIEAQAAQVRKVKRADSGMIYDPVTITRDKSVADALRLMRENRIGGIPVIDDDRHLIGIVTNRDLRFQKDLSLPVEKVMTCENLVTTKNADMDEAAQIYAGALPAFTVPGDLELDYIDVSDSYLDASFGSADGERYLDLNCFDYGYSNGEFFVLEDGALVPAGAVVNISALDEENTAFSADVGVPTGMCSFYFYGFAREEVEAFLASLQF